MNAIPTTTRFGAPRRAVQRLTLLLMAVLLAACSASLLPKPAPAPLLYGLDDGVATAAVASPPAGAAAPSLLVSPTRAAPGFDTRLIAYRLPAQRLGHFARSEWVDTPARLLAPLLVSALEQGGSFRAVLSAPSGAATTWRVETELLRLEQDFSTTPSQVHLTLRAALIDARSAELLATRVFSLQQTAATDDAAGGVLAAQQATRQLAQALAAFGAEVVAARPPAR